MRPGASGLVSGTVESVPDWECGHFLPLQPAGEQPCTDCWSPDTTPPRPYVLNEPCSQLSAGIFCFTDWSHRPGAPCPCAPSPQAFARQGEGWGKRTLLEPCSFHFYPPFKASPWLPMAAPVSWPAITPCSCGEGCWWGEGCGPWMQVLLI